jgi:hypothetical protein
LSRLREKGSDMMSETGKKNDGFSVKDASKVLSSFMCWIWPVILGWNIYLFNADLAHERALAQHRLFAAENYADKKDLEKMFIRLEERLDKRFTLLEQRIMLKEENK